MNEENMNGTNFLEQVYDFSNGLFAVNDAGLRAARISSDPDKRWVLESGEVLSDAEMIVADYRIVDVVETADDAVRSLFKLSKSVDSWDDIPAKTGFMILKGDGNMEIYPDGVDGEVDEILLDEYDEFCLLKELPTWMNADLIEAATETEPDRRRLMLKTEGRGWVDTTPLVFDADELIDPREVKFDSAVSLSWKLNDEVTNDDSFLTQSLDNFISETKTSDASRIQEVFEMSKRSDTEKNETASVIEGGVSDEAADADVENEKVSDPTVTSVLLDEAKIIGLTAQTKMNDFLNSRREKSDSSVRTSEPKDTGARTVAEEVENVASDAKKALSKFQRDAKKAYRVYKAFREQD